MTPNTYQEVRAILGGRCTFCDRRYAAHDRVVLYLVEDDHDNVTQHNTHIACHNLVLACIAASPDAPLPASRPLVREILRCKPDLLDGLDAEDAAWLRRWFDPKTQEAKEIEALRLKWVGLQSALAQARSELVAETTRWEDLRPTYGRRTKQYREAREQGLEPYINANNTALWAVIKFENAHMRGFRFPWEPAKTQGSKP